MFSSARRARSSGVAAAAALALALGACSSSSDGGDTSEGEPQAGGTLRIAMAGDSSCIDPHQTSFSGLITVGRQFVDSLTDQDPETMELKPWLATSWVVNDTNTEFTFTLRDDVTFSNGTAFDSSVVKANFEALQALGADSPLGSGMIAGLVSVETPDAATAVVTFDEPNAQFLNATSTVTLGMLAPESVAADPAALCTGEGLFGSGPFVLDSWEADSGSKLSKREGYAWGSEIGQHKGDAYLDSIEFSIVPESSVRTGSLQSDQIDVIDTTSPQDIPGFDGNGFTLASRANPGIPMVLFLNREKAVWDDVNVRKAVSMGINREEIMDTLFTDETPPATGALAPTTSGFEDLTDKLAYDPEGAKALLESSGYTMNDETSRYEKDGQPVVFDVLQFYANETPTIELLQQQMSDIGVGVEIRAMSGTESDAVEAAGDWDTIYANWTRTDPDILRTILDATGANPYRNAPSELDAMLQAQASASSEEERQALVNQAQEYIVDQAILIPIHDYVSVWSMSDKVKGFAFEAGSRLRLYDTWLAK